MASSYPASVGAAQVGSYFVQQYYQILQQQPDFAHQFYTDASTVVRIDGDSNESASAIMQIHTLMLSLNFTGIEIKTINSLESWSGGVLVAVSGSVKSKDFSGWRKFVQTFFLAPQEKGYFVLNDIFHFSSEVIHQHPVPVPSENRLDSHPTPSSPLPESPVHDYALGVEASENLNSVHIEGDDPVGEYILQEQEQQQEEEEEEEDPVAESVEEETPVEESYALLQNAVETDQESLPSVEESVGEPQKFTYASILRAPKGKSAPSVATLPFFNKSLPPASEWLQTPQPTAQPTNYVSSFVPDSSVEVTEEGLSQEEGESKSVYVKNLPSTVSTLDILEEFKNFGTIKPDGVFIKNRKDLAVCYAFVEFEGVESVQNAIKASPIQIFGRQVYIEERRANSSNTSRGGRRGRGRATYQHEAPRGRFGARTSGRGSNQDGGDNYRYRGNGVRGSY